MLNKEKVLEVLKGLEIYDDMGCDLLVCPPVGESKLKNRNIQINFDEEEDCIHVGVMDFNKAKVVYAQKIKTEKALDNYLVRLGV